jgi:hemolysin activation/secretion protein
MGVGQLPGLFVPVQAQADAGLQQNKLEQELLRDRLQRRQQELQKPLPLTQPDQAPVVAPADEAARSASPPSGCGADPYRLRRISLVDDQGRVLVLDCDAPAAGFMATRSGAKRAVEPPSAPDRRSLASCITSAARICNDWRQLRQLRRQLQLVEQLDAMALPANATLEPSIGFVVAEPGVDGSAPVQLRALQGPLPAGLQQVHQAIISEIARHRDLFFGQELSQEALDLVETWLREAQKPAADGRPLPPLEERWQRWLATRPVKEQPALRTAKGLSDLLSQLSLDALGAEGYLGKARLPILRFAWGELRIRRLSSLLSRFGELKRDAGHTCRPQGAPAQAETPSDRSLPIAWDWARRAVTGDLTPGTLFRVDKLSSAVLKLNELGGVNATACIQAGSTVGTSDVVLALRRTDPVRADVQLDNYVVRYTGPVEIQGSLGLEGVFRRGERLGVTAGYSGTVAAYGSRQLGTYANVPLTPGGLSLVGALNWSDYRSLEEFNPDHYAGFYASAMIGLQQVLWRRPHAGLSVRLVGSLNHYEDSIFDTVTYDNRSSAVARLSLLGDLQDRVLGATSPAYTAGQLTFSFGALSRPNPYASYFPGDGGTHGKVNLTVNRLQTFAALPRFTLSAQGQVQLAFNNLNVAEELSLGWPNGVRAYPPGEALGDSGLVGQLTARYELLPDRRQPGDRRRLALKAFVDGGLLWRWSNPYQSGYYPLQLGLWGPGLGLEWGRDRDYSLSLDVAWPLGWNSARATGLDVDGLNPDTRVWVAVRKWL